MSTFSDAKGEHELANSRVRFRKRKMRKKLKQPKKMRKMAEKKEKKEKKRDTYQVKETTPLTRAASSDYPLSSAMVDGGVKERRQRRKSEKHKKRKM